MLIAQFSELVPQGLAEENKVNGALTIGENIGDLGGLGIALKAYELSLGKESVPELVEGSDGTLRQAQRPERPGPRSTVTPVSSACC